MAPTFDRLVVSLSCATRRLLGREAQAPQQTADVVDVVRDAERVFDQLRHARAGPQIGIETGGQRTQAQKIDQPFFLPPFEFRPRRLRFGAECLAPAGVQCAFSNGSRSTRGPEGVERRLPASSRPVGDPRQSGGGLPTPPRCPCVLMPFITVLAPRTVQANFPSASHCRCRDQ